MNTRGNVMKVPSDSMVLIADGSITTNKLANGAVTEDRLAESVKTEIDKKLSEIPIASETTLGGIKLHSKNGKNISGLAVYEDGTAVVATRSGGGLSRDGAGQLQINTGGVTSDMLADGAVTKEKIDSAVKSSCKAGFLDSPQFTGFPTAPTANVGSNSFQLATTAFVRAEIFDILTRAGVSVLGLIEFSIKCVQSHGANNVSCVFTYHDFDYNNVSDSYSGFCEFRQLSSVTVSDCALWCGVSKTNKSKLLVAITDRSHTGSGFDDLPDGYDYTLLESSFNLAQYTGNTNYAGAYNITTGAITSGAGIPDPDVPL